MMILIIFTLVILQLLTNIKCKPSSNVLSCGIFANLTKDSDSLSIPEFNILGIYNIERGKQSCGVTFDGQLHHGINEDKLYIDFIKNKNLKPKLYPSIIGHTRQASYGNIINLQNAHPFGFGSLPNNKGFEFVGVHNGTLKNQEELAKKYKIDLEKPFNNVERVKIDSEILLEILWKTKNFKVLSDYSGAAALMWSFLEKPNEVYLWSGMSKEFDYAHSKYVEERPLCVYLRTKNNMFVSSILSSLSAIGGNDTNSFQIEYNTVYKVTDGDFKNAETWKISRENPIKTIVKNYYYPESFEMNYHNRYSSDNFYFESLKKNHINSSFEKNTITLNLNIHEEKTLKNQNDYGKKVYFNKLRYCKNGHLINGIYTYIKDFGFYYLDGNKKDALIEFENLKGSFFSYTSFTKQKITSVDKIPFDINYGKPTLFYFVEGVMMKTYLDYITMSFNKENLKLGEYLNYRDLSIVSKHPVIDINPKHNKTINKQEVLFNGVLCDTNEGGVFPLNSEKIYYFKSGNLSKFIIKEIVKESVIQLPINFKKDEIKLEQTMKNLIEMEKSIEELEKVEKAEKIIEDDLDSIVKELIEKNLEKPVQDLVTFIDSLKFYEENKTASLCIETLIYVVETIEEFLFEDNKINKNEN